MLTVSLCEVSLLGRKTEKLQISHEGLNHVAIRNGRIQLKKGTIQVLAWTEVQRRTGRMVGWRAKEVLDVEVESRLELNDPWASMGPNAAWNWSLVASEQPSWALLCLPLRLFQHVYNFLVMFINCLDDTRLRRKLVSYNPVSTVS